MTTTEELRKLAEAGRTGKAEQLRAMMLATMNLDKDELEEAGVFVGREADTCWDKWNKDAPTFVAKLSDEGLNALAELIWSKFPDSFSEHRIDALEAERDAAREKAQGIYTASKTTHAARWRRCRENGAPIISTWIDEAEVGQTSDFSALWTRCITEASNCYGLIAYRELGEILKGAFIEIGAALANNRRVVLVGDFEGMSFKNHPLIETANSIEEAILSLKDKKP